MVVTSSLVMEEVGTQEAVTKLGLVNDDKKVVSSPS